MADQTRKITDEDLVSLVNQEFDNALGAPGGELAQERAEAWNYFLRKLYGNEDEDGSKVVTSEVADVVDGMMPSLLRIFTTADNVVSFQPVGEDDEKKAEQESDYVNYKFFNLDNNFELLFCWMFDALIQKNGVVKAYWDDAEHVTTEEYEGLSEDDLLELMGDDELEPVEKSERTQETVEDGQIVKATVFDIKFRRVRKTPDLAVDPVPPEEYRISADAHCWNPSSARFVGHERTVTRSELLEMGFDKKIVDELSAVQESFDSTEKQARRDKTDDRRNSPKARDRSQDEIRLREGYIKVDRDGDGRAELKQVFVSGETLLEESDFDRQPFHTICPHPLPHKHFGQSSADKHMDLQLQSSTLWRQILENLYHTNRPGHAVWNQAIGETTMDDLLTTKVGRVARFDRPIGESYSPMTVPFTAGATFPMLERLDKVKRERSGVSSDGDGLSPEALKNIQTTVLAQSTDLSRMKIEAVARIFAETGFKSLFRHIHELLLKHQQKAEIVKLRGEYIKVSPKEWKHRRNMTVNIGLGVGTREQNRLDLEAIWQKQTTMVEGGGLNLTVTPKNLYNTCAEFVKNSNRKVPEMFFTDPGDKSAPPPSSEQRKLEEMQAQLQARQQQLDAQDNQIKVRRLELERREQDLKHRREMVELERKRKKDQNDLLVAMEQIENKLTELEIQSGRNVPGSRV